jgi:hypothetical protein
MLSSPFRISSASASAQRGLFVGPLFRATWPARMTPWHVKTDTVNNETPYNEAQVVDDN